MGGVSSEAAQKAGGGAMSTRDELVKILATPRMHTNGSLDKHRATADALIAEGWRKKPSRDEVARAIALGVDGVDGEQFDEAAVDYRLEMLQGADAVLALMDRGQ